MTALPRYNRDQWVESFEGQLAIVRRHLTLRLLGSSACKRGTSSATEALAGGDD
jgi:hypothetical protein